MKTEFLKGLGLEEDAISKIMAENGKDIQREKDKTADVQAKLDTATKQIDELSETVKNAEGKDGTITELQKKVKEYEDAETARKEAAKEAERKAAIRTRFDPLKGENEYLNEGTENWIFGEFEKALSDKTYEGKSDTEIYTAITKDKNIFVNPQEPFKVPPQNPNNRDTDGIEKAFLARNPNIKI